MTNRRAFLSLGASALPALALTVPAMAAAERAVAGARPAACTKDGGGASAKLFPNLVVMTHEGQKAWFYGDLIKGKIVGLNFMSVRGEAELPVTANLARVQDLLGERLGRDVFLVSITTDPEHDTPAALEAFAKTHNAGEGWTFVTAKPEVIQALVHHLGAHGHGGGAGSHHSFRYGNENYARWAAFHALAAPEQLARRFDWVTLHNTPARPKA